MCLEWPKCRQCTGYPFHHLRLLLASLSLHFEMISSGSVFRLSAFNLKASHTLFQVISVVPFRIILIKSFSTMWWPKAECGIPRRKAQSPLRKLHPLIRVAAHLSCRCGRLLWPACWCPSLCLGNFPGQLTLILSGTFNRAFPFSVHELFSTFPFCSCI